MKKVIKDVLEYIWNLIMALLMLMIGFIYLFAQSICYLFKKE